MPASHWIGAEWYLFYSAQGEDKIKSTPPGPDLHPSRPFINIFFRYLHTL